MVRTTGSKLHVSLQIFIIVERPCSLDQGLTCSLTRYCRAVVVLCKNQFYYFSALWPDTGHVAVDEADIFDVLHAIQKHADQTDGAEASKTALGVLTSLPRSKWAVRYVYRLKDGSV